ncbi:MAG: phosphotransferase [Lachnospiraceae bacterium]|nr:phosphotransferase [Lachnospiraceae bacterium]
MQFNQEALDAKMRHLDEIKSRPDVVEKVLSRNLSSDYEITENTRVWIGGGATSYTVNTQQGRFFLKIKHKDVTVESKLEEESGFISEPCIEHEYRMVKLAEKAGTRVPRIIFFDEEEGFQFLAVEYVENSFEETLERATIEEVLEIWQELVDNVQRLFEEGIVHSDIHEYNIRYKNGVVLIDFEEAREFTQKCSFEESLDCIGKSGKSSLGEFPLADKQAYSVKYNSLARMRQVIKAYLVPKALEHIKKCYYDSSNGICAALDHGTSELTYQSIQNDWINVKGQRDQQDFRPLLIQRLFSVLCDDSKYTFIDVGSNNGLFGRELSKASRGNVRCIGLEGFHAFNVLAKALAFLEDCKNTEYYDFLCGEDDLSALKIEGCTFWSICSVWHHIQKREAFLSQLKALDIQYIFMEMPVQQECYDGHSWEEEVQKIKGQLGFAGSILLGFSKDYQRPLVLLMKGRKDMKLEKKIKRTAKRVLSPTLLDKMLALK